MNVGFLGGSNILGCGDVNDFLRFFDVVKEFVAHDSTLASRKYLICERLYRKYVRHEDLLETVNCMRLINNKIMNSISEERDLFRICTKIYDTFNESLDCCKDFFDEYKKYRPIMIVISTMPYCAIDINRSLEKLDTWDGPPFWTRFYLKELADQGKPLPELPF